jgi:hypothetical protein
MGDPEGNPPEGGKPAGPGAYGRAADVRDMFRPAPPDDEAQPPNPRTDEDPEDDER